MELELIAKRLLYTVAGNPDSVSAIKSRIRMENVAIGETG